MRRRFAPDLYLITDRKLCAGLGLERVVGEAVAGGVTMVQLRDDLTASSDLVALARRLKDMLEPMGVPLIVNNRLEVALAADANGLHVGQADITPLRARQELGQEAILGLSITDPNQLEAVDATRVDYLGVGPIFATATKADAAPAIGQAGLAACRSRTALPIVAIGGLDHGNAEAVMRAGADGIAVVSAICGAVDPRAAARSLVATIRKAQPVEARH
ncbi:MAG: thiamine phosphate synthase [Geminicoccaceae bacterium]